MANNRLNMLKSVQMPSTSSERIQAEHNNDATNECTSEISETAKLVKRGRPSKTNKGVNATFSLDARLLRDIKLISVNEGRPQKQMVAEILTDFVNQYKATHKIVFD